MIESILIGGGAVIFTIGMSLALLKSYRLWIQEKRHEQEVEEAKRAMSMLLNANTKRDDSFDFEKAVTFYLDSMTVKSSAANFPVDISKASFYKLRQSSNIVLKIVDDKFVMTLDLNNSLSDKVISDDNIDEVINILKAEQIISCDTVTQ